MDVDDIVWIRANGNTVLLHMAMHELRGTIAALAARLDPRHFARVHHAPHRQRRWIATVQPWFNGHHIYLDTDAAAA